jgi:hypothetical protein
MSSRARSALSAKELAAVLSPLATNNSFLRYDETSKAQAAKLHTDLIEAQHNILAALHDADAKLTFAKSTVAEAFRIIFDEKHTTWGLNDKFKDSWTSAMTNRLVNMCRQVTQALGKGKPPAWTRKLPWVAAASPSPSGGPSSSAAPSAAAAATPPASLPTEFFHGWDTELSIAFRFPEGQPHKKEIAKRVFKPEGSALIDPVVAEYADGSTHIVSDITCENLDSIRSSRQSAPSAHVFVEGQVVATHHRIVVKERADRRLLVSMFEQGKQILQVPVYRLGDESKESVDKAAKLMVEIASKYCTGVVGKRLLTKERNAMLAALNLPKPARVPCKRPAATSAHEAPKSHKQEAKLKLESKDVKPAVKTECTKPDGNRNPRATTSRADAVPEDGPDDVGGDECFEEQAEEEVPEHDTEVSCSEDEAPAAEPPTKQPKISKKPAACSDAELVPCLSVLPALTMSERLSMYKSSEGRF